MAFGANLAGASQALDSSLPTIYSEFRLLRDDLGVMRKCATALTLDPHTGTSKNILNYGRLTAYGLTDGVDIAQAQQLADTNTAITPGEVGLQVILPRTTLRRISDPNLLRSVGRMMANAYDVKEDSDGTAQFSSFTPAVGSTGVTIGPGYLNAARALLRLGNSKASPEPAPAPHFCVLHPVHVHVLGGTIVPLSTLPNGAALYTGLSNTGVTIAAGSNNPASDYLTRGPAAIAKLFDVDIFDDANCTLVNTNDAYGAMFSQEGMIYLSEFEPEMMPDDNDSSLRAVELNLVGSYAWGLYRPGQYGCQLLFDATLPTS